jgi:hypothetical protein
LVDGKTVETHNLARNWSDEMVLSAPDIAASMIDGDLWGFRRALLAGRAKVVHEDSGTIVVQVGTTEATLDRRTHLPLSVRDGLLPVHYDYLVLGTAAQPPPSGSAPPKRATVRKMTLGEARQFGKFPLYFVGERFAGHRLAAVQYTYQDLTLSKDVEQVGFFYLPEGRSKGDAPIYIVVEPKSEAVLKDLAEREKAGLVSRDGQVGKVATSHAVLLTVRDDAIIWLYGPDDAIVRAMRHNLRQLG